MRVGMWPSRTAGHNLKSKFARYKGNTDLYQKNTLNRKHYYAVATPEEHHEPASKLAMTEHKYGKHTTNPILGIGAMENSSPPDFVVEQTYAHMSLSIAVGTAVQYRAAKYLKTPLLLPFTTADCIALIVYMANVR